MGTSTAYGGPGGGTPLVPSWLGGADDGDASPASADTGAGPDGQPPADGAAPPVPTNRPPIPKTADPQRFSGARNSFTRFAGSGGSDRSSLGRAISRYVSRSAGGARQAAQRMGASRGAGARFFGFLADAQARGVREALRTLDLESLAGRPIAEIFVGLADYICPGAGTVDEGIAREAYIETIIELASEGLTDLITFTPDQMQTVFELYATHAIEARICNDIGTKAVTMPADAQAAYRVEQQLRDFIRGGVSDALTRARTESPNLAPERIQSFVDAVYESTFAILQILGDAEANQ
ncbi:Qat anti-phage system associated protein QatB [Nitrosomonas sp. Is37]|uniref:Qat anti-phage system associated protein QatB n=1 Tax=Nitrosomonas sp. Is37 TaxID=3080535 RepID=UPI00294ABAB9|nr:Qat anti-phage system associated protein QatB [Nitrosomonas sp. Is37]MDV6344340.1 Qat anti-phage system associated protein QatB [Nitrosomonas sp. Is37]